MRKIALFTLVLIVFLSTSVPGAFAQEIIVPEIPCNICYATALSEAGDIVSFNIPEIPTLEGAIGWDEFNLSPIGSANVYADVQVDIYLNGRLFSSIQGYVYSAVLSNELLAVSTTRGITFFVRTLDQQTFIPGDRYVMLDVCEDRAILSYVSTQGDFFYVWDYSEGVQVLGDGREYAFRFNDRCEVLEAYRSENEVHLRNVDTGELITQSAPVPEMNFVTLWALDIPLIEFLDRTQRDDATRLMSEYTTYLYLGSEFTNIREIAGTHEDMVMILHDDDHRSQVWRFISSEITAGNWLQAIYAPGLIPLRVAIVDGEARVLFIDERDDNDRTNDTLVLLSPAFE